MVLSVPIHREFPKSIDDIIYRISSEDDIIVVGITILLHSPSDEYSGGEYFIGDSCNNDLKLDYEDKLIL